MNHNAQSYLEHSCFCLLLEHVGLQGVSSCTFQLVMAHRGVHSNTPACFLLLHEPGKERERAMPILLNEGRHASSRADQSTKLELDPASIRYLCVFQFIMGAEALHTNFFCRIAL